MRLFFAINVSDEAKGVLLEAQRELKGLLEGARVSWTPPEKWHATLAFLGEVPEASLPDIIDCGRQVASRSEEFEVSLSGFGVFGKRARYGAAVWAGLEPSGPALERLAKDLRLTLHGLIRERDGAAFIPHVTLARIRQSSPQQLEVLRNVLRSYTIRAHVTWACPSFSLFESTPGNPAAAYKPILDFSSQIELPSDRVKSTP